ncbi:hypothetical protein PENSPDRAFT_739885 [Peniophora sp. CONT]|nr:hypothetical protein PENSPDRAFT_739885 [Peniophora sp. CONT]
MPNSDRTWWLRPYQFFQHQRNWLDLEYQPYKKHPAGQPYLPGELPSTLHVATWNVDSLGPQSAQRLLYLLDTLMVYFPLRPGRQRHDPLAIGPAVICLQEVSETALPALLAHHWVRSYFTVLGADPHQSWPRGARFGCVTLLSRAVPLTAAYSYSFHTSGQLRRAIIADVLVQGPSGAEVLRIANAHLESLGRETGTRGMQARELTNWLYSPDVVGGILAGDLNVLTNADEENLQLAGFVDVWDGEPPDHTWWPRKSAVRAGREKNYPPGRLDRIMITRSRAVEVLKSVTRIGLDGQLPISREEISDHCDRGVSIRRQTCLDRGFHSEARNASTVAICVKVVLFFAFGTALT